MTNISLSLFSSKASFELEKGKSERDQLQEKVSVYVIHTYTQLLSAPPHSHSCQRESHVLLS